MTGSFVAIDFETANREACSVCSVGVVAVRDGRVSDTFYSLIHPEPDYYDYFCQLVHGLCHLDTDGAPSFPEVWDEVERRICAVFPDCQPWSREIPFVAHNACFDEKCLRAAFSAYGMAYPEYAFCDTLRASRRRFGRNLPNHQLQTVAAAVGYDLRRHHHALADAEACAAIAVALQEFL